MSRTRERNRKLALEARALLGRELGSSPFAPDDMIGSLAAVRLPVGSDAPPTSPLYADPLQAALYQRHRLEVPIVSWPGPPHRLVRVSAQLYNELADYELLARALRQEL